VKVKAVSLNPLDWKIRKGDMKLMSGSKFPKHIGTDFAGIIEEIGTAVSNFKVGDEVFGVVKNTMKDGALAEYVAVPSTTIWQKPSQLSFPQASSLPLVGAAAVETFQKIGNINPQSNLLINGATGGYGIILFQLLKQYGANITAVTGSKSVEFAQKMGATTVIDYTKVNVLTQSNAYDVVIDLSGKMGFENAKKIMKPNALFMNPTPQPIEIPTSLFKNLFSSKKHIVILSNPNPKNMDVVLSAIKQGMHIEINRVFPFTQAKEAYQYAEQGGYVGKIVIEFN
jgi:NADPH:quinone reductase-like Zn-dependent oxidoreductase